MSKSTVCIGAALIVLASIAETVAISCYQCNSQNNSACTHLEDNGKLIRPTPCPNITGEEMFCRKTVLAYLDFDRQDHYRVYRGCGWIKMKNNCTDFTNDGHEELQCQCFEDGCNGATSTSEVNSLVTLTVICSAFFIANMIRRST